MAKIKFEMPKNPDECRTLGVEDAKEYLRREAETASNPEKGMELAQWVIETAYGPDVYDQLKVCNRKVNTLYSMITTSTFSLGSEIKNFMRSGNGEPTRTE
jgi:aconitase B